MVREHCASMLPFTIPQTAVERYKNCGRTEVSDMPQAIFAYHLGMDAEQYAFFRIPKLLITEPYFRRISTDAKLLYGLMLDRMSLSMRNGWMDDDGHVYIYFTLEEACEQLCCKTDKAVKLFAELDSAKGVGLIRRVKQGLGRPAKIYVLRFMGIEDEPGEDTPEPELPSCRNPDFGKTEVKSSEKPKSGPRKIRSQDLGKPSVIRLIRIILS